MSLEVDRAPVGVPSAERAVDSAAGVEIGQKAGREEHQPECDVPPLVLPDWDYPGHTVGAGNRHGVSAFTLIP